MKNLDRLLARGRELRQKATPGPWFWDGYSKVLNPERCGEDVDDFYVCQSPCVAGDTATTQGAFDLTLIAHACNTQETLEQMLEIAVEALKKIETISITDGCEECSSVWQREYGIKPVKQALKKIEEIAGKIE